LTLVTASSEDGFRHRITVNDHEFLADEPESKGGRDEGPTPVQLLAGALASCTSITMKMYADTKDWDLGPTSVDVEYTSDERSSVELFAVTIHLSKDLSPDQLERLERVAGRCPVHRLLVKEPRVEITERVELV